jgi:hypothetical protein
MRACSCECKSNCSFRMSQFAKAGRLLVVCFSGAQRRCVSYACHAFQQHRRAWPHRCVARKARRQQVAQPTLPPGGRLVCRQQLPRVACAPRSALTDVAHQGECQAPRDRLERHTPSAHMPCATLPSTCWLASTAATISGGAYASVHRAHWTSPAGPRSRIVILLLCHSA